MRGKSHIAMGKILLQHNLPQLPGRCARAFLIGCIQPDRNPATYLKGSLRSRWLRGHNYSNAGRYMLRLSGQLEQRRIRGIRDCYRLGKLMHYTMDAFTWAHNTHFPGKLRAHREYEASLQPIFLDTLSRTRLPEVCPGIPAAELIQRLHHSYITKPGSPHTDTAYAIAACCLVMKQLTGNNTNCQ